MPHTKSIDHHKPFILDSFHFPSVEFFSPFPSVELSPHLRPSALINWPSHISQNHPAGLWISKFVNWQSHISQNHPARLRISALAAFQAFIQSVKMAANLVKRFACITVMVFTICSTIDTAHGQLCSTFYEKSCPTALSVVRAAVKQAVANEKRMGASLLRLHYHDCFVNVSARIHIVMIERA